MSDLNELLEYLREAKIAAGAQATVRRQQGLARFGKKRGFGKPGKGPGGKAGASATGTVRRERGLGRMGRKRGYGECQEFDDLVSSLAEREGVLGEAKGAPLSAINKLARAVAKTMNKPDTFGPPLTKAGKVSRKGDIWWFMVTGGPTLDIMQDAIKAAVYAVAQQYGPVRTWGHQATTVKNYMVGPQDKRIGVGVEYHHGPRLSLMVKFGRDESSMQFGV